MSRLRIDGRMLAALSLATVLAGCAGAGPRPEAEPSAEAAGEERPAVLDDRYRDDRVMALRSFRPARPAVDSGGECVVRESPTPGARLLAGYFPSRAEGEALVTLTVDSSGSVLQYYERRGLLRVPEVALAPTAAARDSVVAAAERRTRITEIRLDRIRRRASAVNRGGGEPSEGVIGLVTELETAAELGNPGARAARVVELCRRQQGAAPP